MLQLVMIFSPLLVVKVHITAVIYPMQVTDEEVEDPACLSRVLSVEEMATIAGNTSSYSSIATLEECQFRTKVSLP